ncbi:hypothetical protein KFE25_000050 [Diacronema lutheri]|uniref:Glutathione transferase n=3 Tax=Diacronema lutheri TaxID=2081491 RepID=A0A8J6C6U2_DIALT|nr:hypothetical protein KFE25_000050 [Diacronema lutheri]
MPDSNARVVAATAVALGAAACVLASRWARCVLRRRASVELLYFNISGLGEPIRLALTLAGQPFVDRRVSFDEFQQLKPTLRFGQVPCLVVDGVELFQSAAILRYVGQAFDPSGTLYPRRDLALASKVDALMDQVADMLVGRKVYKYKSRFGFPDALFTPELTQTVERTWRDETLPRHLGFFIRCLAESPTGWLAGTRAPTVADLLLACVLRTDVANAAPLPQSLLAFVDAVYSLPAVKAFKQAEEAAR